MTNDQMIHAEIRPPDGVTGTGKVQLHEDVARVLRSREGAGYLEIVMLLLAGTMLLIVATMPWG